MTSLHVFATSMGKEKRSSGRRSTAMTPKGSGSSSTYSNPNYDHESWVNSMTKSSSTVSQGAESAKCDKRSKSRRHRISQRQSNSVSQLPGAVSVIGIDNIANYDATTDVQAGDIESSSMADSGSYLSRSTTQTPYSSRDIESNLEHNNSSSRGEVDVADSLVNAYLVSDDDEQTRMTEELEKLRKERQSLFEQNQELRRQQTVGSASNVSPSSQRRQPPQQQQQDTSSITLVAAEVIMPTLPEETVVSEMTFGTTGRQNQHNNNHNMNNNNTNANTNNSRQKWRRPIGIIGFVLVFIGISTGIGIVVFSKSTNDGATLPPSSDAFDFSSDGDDSGDGRGSQKQDVGGSCEENGHCKFNLKCRDFVCMQKSKIGEVCEDNSDCESNLKCRESICEDT